MKKLPKIYQNEFTKQINNNKKSCHVTTNTIEDTKMVPISEILDQVFSGIGYAYNIPLEIKTTKKIYNTTLIARTKTNIVTLENEIIPISEIITIKEKKN